MMFCAKEFPLRIEQSSSGIPFQLLFTLCIEWNTGKRKKEFCFSRGNVELLMQCED
jgi:hypothetical protein